MENYIPSIELPTIPNTLPSPAAIESCKHSETSYTPKLWGLQYAVYRYLEGMTEAALKARYVSVVKSMRSYSDPRRDVIPIVSYQSSWYWHRKEYETRLEFAYRKLPPPVRPQASDLFLTDSPFGRAVAPNGTDVLFRYGKKKHLLDLLIKGQLRIAPANIYNGNENNDARKDEEHRKRYFKSGKLTKITTMGGELIPILGDVTYTVSGSPYHLSCFSCEWDERLFDDFEADACAVVLNPAEFVRRLEHASKTVFPGWYFHHNPVSYFDPYEVGHTEYFEAGMSKDFRFAYQNEYRVLWSQMAAKRLDGYQFVEIGKAHDIMKLVDRNGSPIL